MDPACSIPAPICCIQSFHLFDVLFSKKNDEIYGGKVRAPIMNNIWACMHVCVYVVCVYSTYVCVEIS